MPLEGNSRPLAFWLKDQLRSYTGSDLLPVAVPSFRGRPREPMRKVDIPEFVQEVISGIYEVFFIQQHQFYFMYGQIVWWYGSEGDPPQHTSRAQRSLRTSDER